MKSAAEGYRGLVAVALMLGASVVVAQDDRVQSWLDRMNFAVNNLTYSGTLVFVRGHEIDTLRIWHQAEGQMERLVSLSGLQREVWRDPNSVRCIMPEAQQVLVDTRLAEGVFPSFTAEQLAIHRYSLTLGPVERVAGMAAQVVNIEPEDSYRYGHKLWLDRDSGMLLKSVLVDAGVPVEQLMFTEIKIGGHIAASDLRPPLAPGLVEVEIPQSTANQSATDSESEYWAVEDVPDGFALRSHRHSALGSDARGEHLLFSDGMASVSVYVEPKRAGRSGLTGYSRVGAVNMFGTEKSGFNVTAVGEVPSATVKKMAESVDRRNRR